MVLRVCIASGILGLLFPVAQGADVTQGPTDAISGYQSRVKPIAVREGARTERDFQKAQRAWAERALLTPFRERAAGKEWSAAALEFASRALDKWPGDRTTAGLSELSREGQALQTKGCEDPLIGYLTTWARWLSTDEYYGSRESFQKWMGAAEQLRGGHVLARLCGADFYKADTVVKLGAGDVPARLVRLTASAWQEGGYLPEEDFIFVRHILNERNSVFFDQHYEDIWKMMKKLKVPEWATETIHGRVEIERAWKKRGVKFANAVSPEQWEGFGEHLGKARGYLVRAWNLRQDEPEAATAMIRVAMGSGGGDGESDPRVWFDRAVAAQCDYFPAYAQFAVALTPRWGGSMQEMLALANACAATARFDTELPLRTMSVLNRAYEEVEDFWLLYRLPDVAPAVVKVLRGYVNEPSRAANRKEALAELAVYAHAAGDSETASKSLAEYGDAPLPRPALVKLQELGIDEAILRGDVALLSSPLRQGFEEAEKARAENRLAAAKAGYAALLPQAKGIAASRLAGLIDIVTVEEQLEAGEWATIPNNRTLAGWIQRSGAWHATPEGTPAIRDADGPVRIVYGARIGANFEMRAALKIAGEPRARWFQGLVFGDSRLKRFTAKWRGGFVRFDKGRDIGTARVFFREFVTGLPAVDCPLQETNEFTLRVSGDRLSWSVNGQPIHQNAPMEGLSAEDLVGFGSFRHTWGITTSLQKLEVRRLPSK